jgi:hypothetical protein
MTAWETKSRAYAVTNLSIFGFLWFRLGIGPHLPGPARAITAVLAALLSAALIATGWRRARDSAGVAALAHAEVRRHFHLILSLQWIAIAVAVVALGATHHPHPIPAAVCAIVGLHFFPLARLFGTPAYHLTATALCVVAAATFVLAPHTPALWTALPGIGAATVLYATCAVVLTRGPRHAPAAVGGRHGIDLQALPGPPG